MKRAAHLADPVMWSGNQVFTGQSSTSDSISIPGNFVVSTGSLPVTTYTATNLGLT